MHAACPVPPTSRVSTKFYAQSGIKAHEWGKKIVKNLVNAQTQPGPLSTISRKPIHKTEMRPKERKREREKKKTTTWETTIIMRSTTRTENCGFGSSGYSRNTLSLHTLRLH